MPRFIDEFLSNITMYRLVLYYLTVLYAVALVFGLVGLLPYQPILLLISGAVILGAGWLTNALLARFFVVPTNIESVYITSLILVLIIPPVSLTDTAGIGFLAFVSVWAIASKYILTLNCKHFLNPAAFGIALAALTGLGVATWWVGGNLPLLPFVALGGLLIVRKVRRFDLVLSFIAATLLTIILTAPMDALPTYLSQIFLHTPLFFFAGVMLTEPVTMPATRRYRILYGILIGILFAPTVHVGSLYFTPELALLIGNLFSFIVNPSGRHVLRLVEITRLSDDAFEYIFAPERPFPFSAGQYLEWALPHHHADTRGNRRYFTIASSPAEPTIRLGVKFSRESSSYKRALQSMRIGDTITVTQLAGDFTLPRDSSKKLAFIAGGIGITPFRSMIQHLIDSRADCSIALLYANASEKQIAYRTYFDHACSLLDLTVVYAVTNERSPDMRLHNGFIDRALVEKSVPDYLDRTFYISGPERMVDTYKKLLREMGVARRRIKTDYFPGLA